jgi:hypothetical protein
MVSVTQCHRADVRKHCMGRLSGLPGDIVQPSQRAALSRSRSSPASTFRAETELLAAVCIPRCYYWLFVRRFRKIACFSFSFPSSCSRRHSQGYSGEGVPGLLAILLSVGNVHSHPCPSVCKSQSFKSTLDTIPRARGWCMLLAARHTSKIQRIDSDIR